VSLVDESSAPTDVPEIDAAAPTTPRRSSIAGLWHTVLVAGPAACLGLLGYHHRWIADDGLIVVRAARQILAGNGPVYNIGERAETSTSVLWTWLVVAAGLTGHDVAKLAVYGGLILSVFGFGIAIDGTRRLYGGAAWLAPAGCFVVLAVPPFWDFATSGLETGLSMAWLGLSWWLLVGLDPGRPAWWRYLGAFVFGLGELVRPDLGLVTVAFGVAGWLIVRPRLRQTTALVATAFAVPVAYEIFRMGYYGVLVPNTGIAKEAQQSNWAGGFAYAGDFISPYYLWIPVGLLVLAAAAVWWRRAGAPRPARVVAPVAAVVTGVLLAGYIIKVGGDFMHGRMLLPATFCLLLPVLLLPARIPVLAAVLAVAVWAGVSATSFRVPAGMLPGGFADERKHWIPLTAPHPISEADYRGLAHWAPQLDVALKTHQLVYSVYPEDGLFDYHVAPLRYHRPVSSGLVVRILGTSGTAMPADGLAIDGLGLGYPLAAHTTQGGYKRPGHDKVLPIEWILADYTPDSYTADGTTPSAVDRVKLAAARRALRCGDIAELQHAVRDPMTPGRFFKNLVGAVPRTFMRFPVDPVAAEREFC
jgi:arabinofuranosyltransferase